ncbi:hypothetical protein [Microcoleus vaginatus]|uniref:hypothetical protein n=1 Tax=Microcoleus vaginatus TaxID=119532 RepID=UPI0032AAE0DC
MDFPADLLTAFGLFRRVKADVRSLGTIIFALAVLFLHLAIVLGKCSTNSISTRCIKT